jgi:hypothetical protein
MSWNRATMLRRAGVITAAAAAAVLCVASPAHADGQVDVSISGLSSSMTAGARADSFTVRLQNKTKAEIFPVRTTLVVRLTGLTTGQVRITRGGFPLANQQSASGEVRAVDTLPVSLGPDGKARDSSSVGYGIQFLLGTPSGRADIGAIASVGSTVLGSTSRSTTVKGGASAAPTTTPEATLSPDPTATTSQDVGFSPLNEPPSQAAVAASSGVPVIFYILGAILVAVGGTILWLLFRPRPALVAGQEIPTDVYDQVRPPSLGYPGGPGENPVTRTSVLPPSDPWAGR